MMDAERTRVLRKYGLSRAVPLSAGMESEVYGFGPGAVLKLYAGTASLADLLALQAFYDSLDRERFPYALPRILSAAQEGRCVVTVEERLPGRCMSEILPGLSAGEMDRIMRRYLAAALALAGQPAPPGFERYKLFDPAGFSRRSEGDWHRFLRRYLDRKLVEVAPFLTRDVPGFADRLEMLFAVLAKPYLGPVCLVHGDFFPGNLLVDANNEVTALLDFGLLTMYGDPLFDIATGWVFFDMYDELKVDARRHYLEIVLERLGEETRAKLYRYVLVYSILGANMYSADCADGHYRWCVANLNNESYWRED